MTLAAPVQIGNLTVSELHPAYFDNPRGRHLACLLPPVTGKALVLFRGDAYVEEWTSAMAEARIQELINEGVLEEVMNPKQEEDEE
jgi:hypothetical protein